MANIVSNERIIICNVMSYADARKASYTLLDKTAIISLNNIDMEEPHFAKNENLIGILKLWFEDTNQEGCSGISNEDADKIEQFLSASLAKIERLIVHCEMGVSRSAGTAAAIMKALTGDDQSIFNDKYLVPNVLCYRKVLNALLDDNGNSKLGKWNIEYK